jgi:hypothetical protein
MAWTTKTDHRLPARETEQGSKSPLRTLKLFFDNASHLERPTLLDMGPACSSNIEFFGQKGFKIYVEDFLSDYLDPVPERTAEQQLLNYPAATFNGILCWDIFDFMTSRDAEILIQRLFDLLQRGGIIMALFDARTDLATKHPMRHKILQEDLVIHEPLKEIQTISHHYKNREILKLFCHFEIVKSYYHKNRLREYLFQKLPSTID